MDTGFGVYGLHEQQNWNSEEFVGIDNKGRQLVKDKDNGEVLRDHPRWIVAVSTEVRPFRIWRISWPPQSLIPPETSILDYIQSLLPICNQNNSISYDLWH